MAVDAGIAKAMPASCCWMEMESTGMSMCDAEILSLITRQTALLELTRDQRRVRFQHNKPVTETS